MTRGQYIVRRLVQMLPVLVGITIIVFVMIRAIPGDPAQLMLGEHAPESALAGIRHSMGLDKPIVFQYFYFIRNLGEMNLGDSLHYGIPVSSLIFSRLKVFSPSYFIR